MQREQARTTIVIGASCWVFAILWIFWLLLCHTGDVRDLLSLGMGNQEPLSRLRKHNLAGVGQIRLALTLFAAQAALIGVLAWTGTALSRNWRSGRSFAVAFSVFAIAVALSGTITRLVFSIASTDAIRVSPFIQDAICILFAIVLGGAVFLPEAVTAHTPAELRETIPEDR